MATHLGVLAILSKTLLLSNERAYLKLSGVPSCIPMCWPGDVSELALVSSLHTVDVERNFD
jgi:hypothetical protein